MAVVVFLFFSQPLIFRGVVKKWEGVPTQLPVGEGGLGRVVVLGGMASWNGECNRIRFWQSGDRLMQALIVVNQNPVSDLILSGGSAAVFIDERAEGAYLKDFLQQIGVDMSMVTVDSLSRNSYENALNCAAIFDDKGWDKRITLITSAWHMRRAKWVFERMGFQVNAVGADYMQPMQRAITADLFFPSLQTLISWQLLFKEWVGYWVYRVRY